MNIRRAELKDKNIIAEIANVLYLPIPSFIWNKEDFIEKQINRGEYFLAEKENNIIGIISLRQRRDRMHIETLAIKEGFNKNGFGTELIAFAKQFAQDKGFNKLHAYAFYEYNNINFYIKQGFKLLDFSGYYHNHKYHCLEIKL